MPAPSALVSGVCSHLAHWKYSTESKSVWTCIALILLGQSYSACVWPKPSSNQKQSTTRTKCALRWFDLTSTIKYKTFWMEVKCTSMWLKCVKLEQDRGLFYLKAWMITVPKRMKRAEKISDRMGIISRLEERNVLWLVDRGESVQQPKPQYFTQSPCSLWGFASELWCYTLNVCRQSSDPGYSGNIAQSQNCDCDSVSDWLQHHVCLFLVFVVNARAGE